MSTKHEYTPRGVCAGKIEFDINDNIVRNVRIIGGCAGNGIGIARLAEGMPVDDVITRLESIRCGGKSTSCPAQLAEALKIAKTG